MDNRRFIVSVCFAIFSVGFVNASVSASHYRNIDNEEVSKNIRHVTGKVISKEDNDAVIGASVLVDGTTIGAITDSNGMFVLSNLPDGAKTVTISYIGMATQKASLRPNMVIYLESDTRKIDEVMVVAYGTAKKSSFTGSAGMLKADKIADRPVTSVTSTLLGSMAGVQVSSANGQPGSESSIYIRGLGSISASNTPLIILNGMPYDNSISSINPADIESISVLKDASSAALYGARAANGVIMITTKKGSKDHVSVNVRINQGITTRQTSDYETLGVEDYLHVYWEAARNKLVAGGTASDVAGATAARNLISGTLKYNPFNVADDNVLDSNGNLNPDAQFMWGDDTDWLNAIQQTGNRTDINMSVSGGTGRNDYYLSAGYLDESGYIIGSKFKRYTMNANVNSQITPFMKVGGTLSGNISKTGGVQTESSGGNSNPFRFTRYIGPIYPIHVHNPETKDYALDSDGNKMYDFGDVQTLSDGTVTPGRDYISGNNPAIELQNLSNGNKRNQLNAKAYAEFRLPLNFKLTANAAVNTSSRLSSSAVVYYPEKTDVGKSTKTTSFITTWTFNQLLSWSNDFGRHHVDALLGHESYSYEYNYLLASMQNQTVHNTNYEFTNYSIPGDETSYTDKYKTEGFFSRFNYDYDNRYFLSASVRRDGSSRFYKDSRWGTFFSVGGGWRIDAEPFMAPLRRVIDLLKLRVSYGEVGNDDIGTYYAWQAAYEPMPNGLEAGYIKSRELNSKDLQWEMSHNTDVALEFELFKGRLTGQFEFFNRQSSNLLFEIPKAPDTGITYALQNAGSMYNRGLEIELAGKPVVTKDIVWTLGVNATWLKNKITSLPVEPYNDFPHRVEEGHSRYEFYLRQWAGVDPATGNSIYVPDDDVLETSETLVEVNGKTYTTSVEEAKYDWSGNSMPDVSGGVSTSLSWKGLTLSLLFNWQLGGKMYDTGYQDLMTQPSGSAALTSNKHVDILRRWQKPGDITDVPRLEDFSDTNQNADKSTRWLISSDMLELANATLSYDVPKTLLDKLSIKELRIYASGDNLLLFTHRKGIYPRRNVFSGYSSNPDVYLPARVFSLGLNLTF